MHSIRRTGSGMSKWTPASSSMVRSARSCIQPRNASRPCTTCEASLLEVGHRLGVRRPGENPVGGRVEVVGEPLELLPAPRVRLLEVDPGAEEVARVQRVAVAADGVPLRGRAAGSPAPSSARGLVERRVGFRGVALEPGTQRLDGRSGRRGCRACRRAAPLRPIQLRDLAAPPGGTGGRPRPAPAPPPRAASCSSRRGSPGRPRAGRRRRPVLLGHGRASGRRPGVRRAAR